MSPNNWASPHNWKKEFVEDLLRVDRQPPVMPTPPNRDQQHGGVEAVGAVEQPIKDALRAGKNWERLTPGQKCALDMIAHKLGRIMSGADPGDPEHWEDLAGYPTAAMRAKE
jgi:hypothetical protein